MQISPDGLVIFNHATTPAGRSTHFAACSHPLHECCFYLQGDIHMQCGDADVFPVPGSMVLIPKGTVHTLQAGPGTLYDRYTIHFHLEALPEALREYVYASLLPGFRYLTGMGDLLGDIVVLEACYDIPEPARRDAIAARLGALLTRLAMRCDGQAQPVPREDLVPRMLEFIHMNVHDREALTVDALAQRYFVSKSQLSKRFQRETGISLAKYIRAKRYEYAETLRAQGLPAVEAAAEAGFQSYSTYYRIRTSLAEGGGTAG